MTPRTAAGRRFVDRHGTGKQIEIEQIEDEAARDAARREAALREALNFRASVEFDHGFHGGDLLRGIAAWMDRRDDEYDAEHDEPTSRMVQADLRRWADSIDRALLSEVPQ